MRRKGCVLGWRRISWGGEGFGAGIRARDSGVEENRAGLDEEPTRTRSILAPAHPSLKTKDDHAKSSTLSPGRRGRHAHTPPGGNQKMSPRTKKFKNNRRNFLNQTIPISGGGLMLLTKQNDVENKARKILANGVINV